MEWFLGWLAALAAITFFGTLYDLLGDLGRWIKDRWL